MCCVQTKGALAAAAAASAVAAQVARGRGRAALARGAFVSAAAPGYVTPGSERMFVCGFVVFTREVSSCELNYFCIGVHWGSF